MKSCSSRQLAECHAESLPALTTSVEVLAAEVEQPLKKMGAVWK